MNERNVEALAKILAYSRGLADAGAEVEDWRATAEYLASRGILAPSSLSDEDTGLVRGFPDSTLDLRLILERIAKGGA